MIWDIGDGAILNRLTAGLGEDRLIRFLVSVVVVLFVLFVLLTGVVLALKRGPETVSYIEREIRTLEGRVQQNPLSTNARLDLGWRLYQKGDYLGALAQYEEIKRLNPEHLGARYGEALVFERLGRRGEAIVALKEVVEKNKFHDPAYFQLAKLNWELGNLDEALTNIERAIELQPISSSAHYLKGRILLSKAEVEGALEEFKAAVDYDPNFALGYLGLGLGYASKGMEDEAKRNLNKAIVIDPWLEEANKALVDLSKLRK